MFGLGFIYFLIQSLFSTEKLPAVSSREAVKVGKEMVQTVLIQIVKKFGLKCFHAIVSIG